MLVLVVVVVGVVVGVGRERAAVICTFYTAMLEQTRTGPLGIFGGS